MKFKINWGWGIAIFLFIFIASIAVRIYIASQQQINLVTPEYYPKGIAYEDEIQKKFNYKSLDTKLEVIQEKDSIFIIIPGKTNFKPMAGEIIIYRPSNFEDDSIFNFEFSDENRNFCLSKSFLKRGIYQIKVDWTEDSIPFYAEQSLFVNK